MSSSDGTEIMLDALNYAMLDLDPMEILEIIQQFRKLDILDKTDYDVLISTITPW